MPSIVREFTKKLARLLLGDYSAYKVYAWPTNSSAGVAQEPPTTCRIEPVDQEAIQDSGDPEIREQAGYAGPESCAYACFDGDRIIGVCFYWFGDRYRTRNYWPLNEGEAKLVQIVALKEMRSRGVASSLVYSSSRNMMNKGFLRLYARIWHSNLPSIRAFEKAGWVGIAFVIEVNPFRRARPFRIRIDSKPSFMTS